ncbi:DegT/DnrJ/EryC1/StrS family aminotransferase [Alphaproteobacteria bacterium]|nr:DegT/DnrJ/EryC1/StrS family aminotransferase [Alphaproteobacteria bacterium]
MKVPFFDWSKLYLEDREQYLKIIDQTLSMGRLVLQTDVDDFETSLKALINVKHAIALADGTNAILLGLRASGIGQGDEVILPSHAFIAAAQSIRHAGAIPVVVDIDPIDWMLSPSSIEKYVTERTKAIMPVHVNGRMCNMEEIMLLAEKYGLKVFEDAAQALGAKFDGVPAGHFGEWATFSFYPSKTLGSFGDAGALVTQSTEIAKKVVSMRNHGADETKTIANNIDLWGTNCRLDNLQAAILNYKLTKYDDAIRRRRAIALCYQNAFSTIPQLNLPPKPSEEKVHFDIFQNYELRAQSRDELRKFLAAKGVGTIVQWGGLALHQLKNLGLAQTLPETDAFFDECLLLPMNHMLTNDDVDYVIENVTSFYRVKEA